MEKKCVALTFDDGPSADTTPAILELLEKYNAKASFFVCGHSITDQTAPIMRRAFDMGCEINNHSYTHPAFTELTEAQMLEEVDSTTAKVEQITGRKPRFFRPPFISVDKRVMKTVRMPFICGEGTQDWEPQCSADKRYNDIMAQVRDGIIILMHDFGGNEQTVEAVSRLIPDLQAQGFSFVTVSELFRIKGVEPDENRFVYSAADQKTVMYREKWYVGEENLGDE